MKKGKLGVIGGMGPQATLTFYQRLIDFTAAGRDQEHIPTLILSDSEMPDRTAALLSGETEPVKERLLADAKHLEDWGACCIAIPCNTSHAFVPWLRQRLGVPILNMIEETAAALKDMGCKRAGILATDGTIRQSLYHAACERVGVEAVSPPADVQRLVMSVIYDEIKKGEMGSREKFSIIGKALRELNCDRAVLACTELSVYRGWHNLSGFYVDAMDILAQKCVETCGYTLKSE